MVTVNSKVATVTVPDKVTCSLSGSSVPIVVTADAVPFSDIKVSLEKSIATDEAKTDNSVGITVNAGEVVTLKVGTNQGVLGFACAATVTGKELKYKLDGTDKAQFSIIEKVSVTAQKAGTKPATPAMKLAMVADKSTASKTTIEGECPGLGGSWIGLTTLAQGDKVCPPSLMSELLTLSLFQVLKVLMPNNNGATALLLPPVPKPLVNLLLPLRLNTTLLSTVRPSRAGSSPLPRLST